MRMRSYELPKTPQKKKYFPSAQDYVNEENSSSNKESLLVSPHSKFSRFSPKRQDDSFGSIEQSLNRYTKPFESPEFLRTDEKITTKRFGSTETDRKQKITQPDFTRSKDQNREFLEQKVHELLNLIEEKDQKINELEMRISGERYPLKPQQLNTFSPNRNDSISFEEKKQDKKAESLRREILFLTQNNLQLFQEVHRLSTLCQEFKQKALKKSSLVKNLQSKLQEVTKQFEWERQKNLRLVSEKKEMMKNYEQQISLFLRMKEVWEHTYEGDEGKSKTTRKRAKSNHNRVVQKKKPYDAD